jgi:hypothetical protein
MVMPSQQQKYQQWIAELRVIEEVATPEEVTSATYVAAVAAVPVGTEMPEAKIVEMAIAGT